MIINLCLLNYFFGETEEFKKTEIIQSEVKKENKNQNISNNSMTVVNLATTRNKLKISHFPKPPIHTFVGNESAEIAEDEENIKTKGVIIK